MILRAVWIAIIGGTSIFFDEVDAISPSERSVSSGALVRGGGDPPTDDLRSSSLQNPNTSTDTNLSDNLFISI